MRHYEARLTAGFERHLAECFKFYSSGGGGWWKSEAAGCVAGMEWCRAREFGEFKYRFEGLELKRI